MRTTRGAAAAGAEVGPERPEAELRSQLALLEKIVDTAPSLLCVLGPDGRVCEFNRACEAAIAATDVDAVLRQPFWEVLVADGHRDAVQRAIEATAATHEPAEFESSLVDGNGTELVVAWMAAPVLDEQTGALERIVCSGVDITERRSRERELDRERDFLRTVADTPPSLLVVVDEGAIVVGNAVNKGFERTMGWTEQEMLGRSFLDLLPSEEVEAARIRVGAAFEGVESPEQLSRWRARDGADRIIAWIVTPIVDLSGRELALVCGVDVTERERREADLRASEERLRAAIEASPVAIVEYDLDDRITVWNPAAERIFGWTTAEVLGGPARHQPPGRAKELAELFRRVRAGRVYTAVESRRVRKDGSSVEVEISAAAIRDASGEVVSHMALLADITDRKRQQEEVRASRARLVQAADDARRVIERNLHDGAQQRLVTLSLTLGLAQMRLGSDPAEAGRLVEGARAELAEALAELRELARGIHPAILTERGLAAAVEALAGRSRVPVDVRVPPERLPGPIEAAAYYVVAEALANVAKYAQASAATVRIQRENGQVLVEVSDDGVGGAEAAEGSGLRGLGDRISALDGTLEIESAPGAGTRLRAALPAA